MGTRQSKKIRKEVRRLVWGEILDTLSLMPLDDKLYFCFKLLTRKKCYKPIRKG